MYDTVGWILGIDFVEEEKTKIALQTNIQLIFQFGDIEGEKGNTEYNNTLHNPNRRINKTLQNNSVLDFFFLFFFLILSLWQIDGVRLRSIFRPLIEFTVTCKVKTVIFFKIIIDGLILLLDFSYLNLFLFFLIIFSIYAHFKLFDLFLRKKYFQRIIYIYIYQKSN